MKKVAVNCACISDGKIKMHRIIVIETPRKRFEDNIKLNNSEICHEVGR
jgi:hypothetical protein